DEPARARLHGRHDELVRGVRVGGVVDPGGDVVAGDGEVEGGLRQEATVIVSPFLVMGTASPLPCSLTSTRLRVSVLMRRSQATIASAVLSTSRVAASLPTWHAASANRPWAYSFTAASSATSGSWKFSAVTGGASLPSPSGSVARTGFEPATYGL